MNKQNTELDERIYNLVKEEYEKFTFSKEQSNQARLSNKCQAIIYSQWGIANDYIWAKVNKVVNEFIPDFLD